MNPAFDNTYSEEKGGFTPCCHNIRRGGYLMMMLDYKGRRGERGSRIWEKVIT